MSIFCASTNAAAPTAEKTNNKVMGIESPKKTAAALPFQEMVRMPATQRTVEMIFRGPIFSLKRSAEKKQRETACTG